MSGAAWEAFKVSQHQRDLEVCLWSQETAQGLLRPECLSHCLSRRPWGAELKTNKKRGIKWIKGAGGQGDQGQSRLGIAAAGESSPFKAL
jgi:hypothetical protein